MKDYLLGMSMQAFVTAGSYLLGFGDNFGRQVTIGLLCLFASFLLAWRKSRAAELVP